MATATEKGWVHFNGLHLSGTGNETFRIATKRILDLRAKGHFRKFLELFSIEEVLLKPTVIFEGLCRPQLEDGFCYCATPTRRYISEDGGTAQAHAGLVFTVFVTRDFVVFEFGWERMSGIKPGFPDKYETRFTKQKYPEII